MAVIRFVRVTAEPASTRYFLKVFFFCKEDSNTGPTMSSDLKKNLLLFFERPTEPCFMKKGEDGAVFQLPTNYFPEKYKEVSAKLSDRFGEGSGRAVPVRNIALPDLSLPMQLPFNDHFSLFIPKHRDMAGRLISILMGMRNLEDLQSLCAYCQLHINPYLFNYCLSVAILHRDDTKGLNIPTYAETFPDKFMDPKVFRKARETSNTVTEGNRMPLMVPQNYTASDLEPEQRVAYFREDIGVNLHHWHWHLVYPFEPADPKNIVNKDRRGELFYYMHEQIVARYNVERMCNKLKRVTRYSNFKEPIDEGYFPKLDSYVASRSWPPRFAGSVIRDINRPANLIQIEVSQLENWKIRFEEAVREMAVLLPNGKKMKLNEETGIDVLGNIMESSVISVNRSYYGDLHNMGHVFLAYCHDPDNSNLELNGVIGDSGTAMRDPVFYRWHAFVDDLFQEYKNKLPPYTNDKLVFPGVQVSSITLEAPRGANKLSTQWEQSQLDLGRGMDFTPRGSLLARFTHLQHDEFTYKIDVNNTSGKGVTGTVRIFMAPTKDQDGNQLSFNDQRRLMIELDKFSKPIPAGKSSFSRKSTQSSVTIPHERTFRNQGARPADPGTAAGAEFDFCGCGWPHHLLIPKGTAEGYPVVVFVMISNWEQDKVQQDISGACNDAASYCGIRDRKYPDRRAMGFPFDRPIKANRLTDFLKPNMAVRECTIQFKDQIRQRAQ
ncbi:phenoloxidase subunit 1-like [Epargyreus clarus]|uniref:phenoloxidase subunit 1-like n=1 Tax=Epargyreus clarus TaxID=520877 RepID=UPI003C2C39A4